MKKLIYLPDIIIKKDSLELNSPYFINYIKNVLRYKEGEFLDISNENTIYTTKIDKISKKIIKFKIIDLKKDKSEKTNKIILIQSLFSWPRLEWLVEKVVELGIDEIIFIQTGRSKIKINNWEAKKERIYKIIYKALTQSHRGEWIKINPPVKLDELKLSDGFKIIFDTKDENLTFTPSILNNVKGEVYIAIGPEGGFSEDEKELFYSLGFKPYKLPLPILRAETAAIVSVAFINAKLNEVKNDGFSEKNIKEI